MFKNAKVLVTGGTGFIGVNLILRLLEQGAQVRATLHDKNPVINDSRIEYLCGDLCEKEMCQKSVEGMDYVFMCAANTSGAKIMATTPLVHLTPNVVMNTLMLDTAYSAGVKKFLFVSSNAVYPLTDFAVKESDVTGEFFPAYHIGASMKIFTENVCEIYSTRINKPMQTVVVRPGNLYGPYDKFDWEKSKVFPALIRRAIERQDPFVVWGDGKDLKDFLYIDDLITGMLLAMEKLGTFEPINIASSIPITIREILAEILKATDYEDAPVEYDETKPTMIPKRMIDISLAQKNLGFSPKMGLQDGIKNTVNWYKEFHRGNTPEDL